MRKRYDWPHFEAFWADFRDKVPEWQRTSIEAEVMSKIRLGWKDEDESYKAFKLISQKIKGLLPKTIPTRSVAGGVLRVPALLAGRPDHFMRNVPLKDYADNKKGKSHIRICCNVDAVAGVTPELFKLRGATIVALAEALEMAGKRTEITVAIATAPYGYYWGFGPKGPLDNQRYFVTVKPFSSPISPLIHAYQLMSPSILRKLFFAFWQRGLPPEEHNYYYKGTYGAVGTVPDHGADLYIAEFGNHNAGEYTTIEGAKDWVIAQMKEFGLDVEITK